MSWFWFCIFVFAASEIWRRISAKGLARKIVKDSKALYSNRHEFAEVRAADFRDHNHKFYNRAQAELEAFGFRYLADIEDLTLTRQYPAMRTFIRSMTGDQGSTCAGIYQLKFRGFYRLLQLLGVLAKKPFYVDLESEFSDGIFLATSNTGGTDLSGDVPGILRQKAPAETSIPQLLAAHREQVSRLCQEGRTTIKVNSVTEVRALQHRLQDAKNRHKQSIGHVDAEQVARIAAKHGDPEANHQLALELKTLRAQNLAASPSTTTTPAVSVR